MKDYPELQQLKNQKHKAPQNLLIRTENLMDQQLKIQDGGVKMKKNIWKILIPVIAATAILAVSVSAYAFEWFSPQEPRVETHIPESTPEHIYEEDGTVLQQDDLQITILSTAADNQNMYVNIEIRTLDGSSLRTMEENAASCLIWQKFENYVLTVDGAEVWSAMFRLDDGSEPDRILYELYAYSDGNVFENAQDKEISLHLEDLTDYIYTWEDIDFKFENMKDLVDQMSIEPKENFIDYSTREDYSGRRVANWLLPAGDQEVYFSDKLPNSYIDNIGFMDIGASDIPKQALYVSIVPGNDEERKLLDRLFFQNKHTKMPDGFGMVETFGNDFNRYVEDGERMIFALEHPDYEDISEANLADYLMVLNFWEEEPIICEGKWDIPINVTDTARHEYVPYSDVPIDAGILTIQNVSISNISMYISGVYTGTGDVSTHDTCLIFEDGTKELADPKNSGGGSIGHGEFEFEYIFPHILDAETVVAIEFMGHRIDLQ